MIVDTGPLVAALNAKDNHHRDCVRLLTSHEGPLWVPGPVLTEVCWLLARTNGACAEGAFLDSVARGEVDLVAITASDAYRMAELVRRYADLPLGAADASVVAIAERMGIREIATLDRRHFSIVRPNHAGSFNLFP